MDFFVNVVFVEAVTCTGVFVSCDDVDDARAVPARLGPGLSLGKSFVDAAVEDFDFEVDFDLPEVRAIIYEAEVRVGKGTNRLKERGIKSRLYIKKRMKLSFTWG